MSIINWNDSLSVKVKEIDLQHQKLVSMINELHDAMTLGKGKEILTKIINGLINYTQIHFKTEENYFAQYGYPETNTHKMEHNAFIQKVSEFKEEFNMNKFTLTIDIMNFLSNWLHNHIQKADKKYSQFFTERGLN